MDVSKPASIQQVSLLLVTLKELSDNQLDKEAICLNYTTDSLRNAGFLISEHTIEEVAEEISAVLAILYNSGGEFDYEEVCSTAIRYHIAMAEGAK